MKVAIYIYCLVVIVIYLVVTTISCVKGQGHGATFSWYNPTYGTQCKFTDETLTTQTCDTCCLVTPPHNPAYCTVDSTCNNNPARPNLGEKPSPIITNLQCVNGACCGGLGSGVCSFPTGQCCPGLTCVGIGEPFICCTVDSNGITSC